jgi:hypothetical protein
VYLLEAGSDLSGMLDDGLASPVGIMDFPPWAGHRGYAARVDGSGWSCRCRRSHSSGGR